MKKRKLISAYVERAAGRSTEPGSPITFVASTEGIKRDGLDLRMQDWYLDNFRKNPVFLWAHDYYGRTLPLGHVEVRVEGDRLMADVKFDQGDEFARQIERKYRDGFLHTVSVGWNFVEVDKKRVMDLLDVSAVPVPGDPDALVVRQFESERELESAEDAWETVSAAMAALYAPTCEEADDAREADYKRLLPKYRRLGKVAPEYLPIDEVRKLTPELVRGLFLEGEEVLLPESEPEARAGAVLSSRNKEDLTRAIELIQSVLERATPEAESAEAPEVAREAQADLTGLMTMATAIQTNLMTRSMK